MRTKQLLLALGLAGLTQAVAQAQYTLICEETFSYGANLPLGGQTGGTGWGSAWWSGNNLDDALVTSPGFDAVGNKITTNAENAGSYRILDPAPWPDMTDDQDRFGADGSVMWVSWTAQKVAGTTDEYGGFSFNEILVAEKLFVGECYQTGLLGIDPVGGPPVTIPGTDPFALTRFVVRIEHLPGPENLKLWLNPATDHPTTPADLDEMVPDFVWNEVRFQSGQNGGGSTGYDFDNLVIEREDDPNAPIGTHYCSPAVPNTTGLPSQIEATGSDVAGGNPLSLRAFDMPAGEFGYFLTSQTQGFIANPAGSQGNLCVVGNIGRFNSPVLNSGANGEFIQVVDTLNIPTSPASAIAAGETWNFQAWHRDFIQGQGATSNFTDAVSITFN